MHPQIAAYVSRASYDGQLEDAPEVQAYEFVTRKPLPVALHFVDTDGMRGSRERRGPGGALRNETEVRVAAHVVRLLDERCSRDLSMAVHRDVRGAGGAAPPGAGAAQVQALGQDRHGELLRGQEEDLVVISLVRSNERGRIGFLRVPNRLNVAVSRARRLVACIGDAATLRSGEESMYGVLVEAAQGGGRLHRSASEVVSPRRHTDHPFGPIVETAPGEGAGRIATAVARRPGTGVSAPPALGPDGEPLVPARAPRARWASWPAAAAGAAAAAERTWRRDQSSPGRRARRRVSRGGRRHSTGRPAQLEVTSSPAPPPRSATPGGGRHRGGAETSGPGHGGGAGSAAEAGPPPSAGD